MKRWLRLLIRFVTNTWQAHAAYRLGAVIWIINGMVSPLILMNIWLLISRHQALVLTEGHIITYYLFSVVMTRLTQSWSAEDLSKDIKAGNFSNTLIKPVDFSLRYLGKDIAMKFVRLVTLLPFFIVFLWIFRDSITLSADWLVWILGLLAILAGYVLNLFLELLLGLTSLWIEEGYGTVMFVYLIASLFNGFLVPLSLLPKFWQQLALILPFRFVISFPIEILMGTQTLDQAGNGFLFLGMWTVVLFSLYKIVFRAGIKKYSAVGT